MNRVFEVHYAPAECIGMLAGESRYCRRGSRKQAEKAMRKIARDMNFDPALLEVREYKKHISGLATRVS